MCDVCDAKGAGWRGWLDLPPPPVSRPLHAAWTELSHQLHPDMPRIASFPRPRFERLRSIPTSMSNVTEMQMAVHTGTHVDSPRHFFSDGPPFEEIPFERLHGPGVVWHIDAEPDSVIGLAALNAASPALQPGDIVALDTGWAARVGDDSYNHHPSLAVDAAEWLVEQKAKLLACDFGTPDLAPHARPEGFAFPVHHVLLSRGVLVCEHLTGHAKLAGQRVEFIFSALNIRGSDGAPARVIARPIA
jgi:kynurenine formamidase